MAKFSGDLKMSSRFELLKVMTRCCMSLYFAFNICASTNILSLWISIKKQLHNMHHLTTMSTDDLMTCIEHLAFWFYTYHQNSHSSVVSYITPTWVVSLLLCFLLKARFAQRNMIISRDLFTKQDVRNDNTG